MDAWMWIVLALVVLVVLALFAWPARNRRRTQQLQEGFGPEYEHVVEETGDNATQSESCESGRSAARSSRFERSPRRRASATRTSGGRCRDGSWTSPRGPCTTPTGSSSR